MLISRHVFCDKRDEEITFKRHTKITQQQPKSWKIIKSSQSQVKLPQDKSHPRSPSTQHDEDQPCFPSAFSSCRSSKHKFSEFMTYFMDHFQKYFSRPEIILLDFLINFVILQGSTLVNFEKIFLQGSTVCM